MRDSASSSQLCGCYNERAVMLQAMKEEPPLSAKCRDKFLIQSTFITPDKEAMPVHDIVWVPSPYHWLYASHSRPFSGVGQMIQKTTKYSSKNSRSYTCHLMGRFPKKTKKDKVS